MCRRGGAFLGVADSLLRCASLKVIYSEFERNLSISFPNPAPLFGQWTRVESEWTQATTAAAVLKL